MNKGTDNGIIKVSDEVLAVCAINATLKTEGVVRMDGGISNTLSKNILGHELASKGAKASQNKDKVEIDLYVIARYGIHIPQMAWDIQENVKKEIKDMTNMTVTAVNIHVQGVEIND
ncbi:MAG: Asp23/Gls24 family envelope stress response protein [Firmicutes bacterium]|mgnify:FL=1|nr:Asp23/Gls24 family envelope stress response protein [Bacillota bacterium]